MGSSSPSLHLDNNNTNNEDLYLRRSRGSGDGERRGPGVGAPQAPSIEDDDFATLFNSVQGPNGILNENMMSQMATATQGHKGLQKLTINLSIKVVLVKIGDKTIVL